MTTVLQTAVLQRAEQALEPRLERHAPLEAAALTGPDDPAFWLCSSGSTGQPEGTVHSHADPCWTA